MALNYIDMLNDELELSRPIKVAGYFFTIWEEHRKNFEHNDELARRLFKQNPEFEIPVKVRKNKIVGDSAFDRQPILAYKNSEDKQTVQEYINLAEIIMENGEEK